MILGSERNYLVPVFEKCSLKVFENCFDQILKTILENKF